MSDLLSEQHDGIGVVTRNRPDRLHAIGFEMLDALGFTERRPPRFAGR
jgi:enoyl-CoA hydratase/carnithine racemase